MGARPSTAEQRERIRQMLANPLITARERTWIRDQVSERMSYRAAEDAIEWLDGTIERRLPPTHDLPF